MEDAWQDETFGAYKEMTSTKINTSDEPSEQSSPRISPSVDTQTTTDKENDSPNTCTASSSWLDIIGSIGDAQWEVVPDDPRYWEKQAVIFSSYSSSSQTENALRQALRLPQKILRLLCDRTLEYLRGDLCKRRQWLKLMNLSGFELLSSCEKSHISNVDEIRRLIFSVIEYALRDASLSLFEHIKTLRTSTLNFNLIGHEDLLDIQAKRIRSVLKDIAIRAFDVPLDDRGVTPLGKLSYISLYGQSTNSKISLIQTHWKNMVNDRLELEFEKFVHINKDSKQDLQTREEFTKLVETLITQALNVNCYPYGSRVTGLTLRDSDLDLGIKCPEYLEKHGEENAPNTNTTWNKLGDRSLATRLASHAYHLIRNSQLLSNRHVSIDLRAGARKPLIRFVDEENKLSADVVFGNNDLAGCRNSALLAHYARMDPRVKPLVILVKYWSKRRLINGSYIGFLSSFGHTLTMIEFLQKIQPPVIPNIQMPDFPEEPGSGYADEDLSQDPSQLGRRDLPWQSWDSQNEMTLGQLLRAYFGYMAFECPWVSNIISPRTAPYEMSKKLTFLENNGLNASLRPATVNNRYEWIYTHPKHTLKECVQDRSSNLVATFYRICVEDPSEKERLLLPHRQYAQDQTTYEHIRAYVLLEAGYPLDVLCRSIVPLSDDPHGNQFIDMVKLRETVWWGKNGSTNSSEDDIVSRIRADCVSSVAEKLRSCDLLAPPDVQLFPSDDTETPLILHWRQNRICQRLAHQLHNAEEAYVCKYLTSGS